MQHTAHSEYGRLQSLFLKKAANAFISDASIEKQWQLLNYTGKPDFQKCMAEYEKFESFFTLRGVTIHYLPEDLQLSMDSIYCRDAAIATDGGMIICNMGKQARLLEPAAQEQAFYDHRIPVLGRIVAPGTLEGGDVAWIDQHTLAVGHSYRTNEPGIAQLAAILQPLQVDVVVVPLPHYKGINDVFHLMSIFSPVDSDLAVVYSPLMPIAFRNLLLERGFHLVEVPDEEFESMGCNVLALAPRECLIVSGNVTTHERLRQNGCRVWEYSAPEISIKGGGGPTCLTRPVRREC